MKPEAVWRRNGEERRGQMRSGPFSCVRCRRGRLEGAGRVKQKEHTVRAGAIHAKIEFKCEQCSVNRKIRDREMRDAMREMEMEMDDGEWTSREELLGEEA